MDASYRIDDEPLPGALAGITVRPSMPLLACMLAGAWLGWPWFVVNAFAMGSPTWRKELAIAGGAVAGTVLLALIVVALDGRGLLESPALVRLALLGLTAWKLAMAYWLCEVQGRTFALYEHYRGVVRRAWPLMAAGIALRPFMFDLFDSLLWKLVIRGGL